ncbi:MAG: hypothetical protein R3C49_08555 [Planctomycetaceae bacterium]
MMNAGRMFLCFALAVAALPLMATADAQSGLSGYGSPRQYYSSWSKHPTKDYHYRRLYYKPSNSYVGYKHHYVIYYPSKPQHCYFFNPYSKTYWGRCEINHGGKYSLLAPQDRKTVVTEIPESAFPKPADPPVLDDTEDNIRLDLPPDDLPLE